METNYILEVVRWIFKELEYVLSIAKNNSISKAAKELYISQPSLSKYLQNLEKNMDVKLLKDVEIILY